MAFLKGTTHRHRLSTCSNSINWTCLPPFIVVFFIVKSSKRARVDILASNNNRGMTYQTDGNHLSRTIGYLVGGMVQAWVAHFVTLLKCIYDEYD
jgi:hypothetical protein